VTTPSHSHSSLTSAWRKDIVLPSYMRPAFSRTALPPIRLNAGGHWSVGGGSAGVHPLGAAGGVGVGSDHTTGEAEHPNSARRYDAAFSHPHPLAMRRIGSAGQLQHYDAASLRSLAGASSDAGSEPPVGAGAGAAGAAGETQTQTLSQIQTLTQTQTMPVSVPVSVPHRTPLLPGSTVAPGDAALPLSSVRGSARSAVLDHGVGDNATTRHAAGGGDSKQALEHAFLGSTTTDARAAAAAAAVPVSAGSVSGSGLGPAPTTPVAPRAPSIVPAQWHERVVVVALAHNTTQLKRTALQVLGEWSLGPQVANDVAWTQGFRDDVLDCHGIRLERRLMPRQPRSAEESSSTVGDHRSGAQQAWHSHADSSRYPHQHRHHHRHQRRHTPWARMWHAVARAFGCTTKRTTNDRHGTHRHAARTTARRWRGTTNRVAPASRSAGTHRTDSWRVASRSDSDGGSISSSDSGSDSGSDSDDDDRAPVFELLLVGVPPHWRRYLESQVREFEAAAKKAGCEVSVAES